MNQYKMDLEVRLLPITNNVRSLWDLVDSFDRGTIVAPLHQRDRKSWDEVKRSEWIKRIADVDLPPVGVIVTYQINDGRPSPVYLNDGLQRISTISEYKNFPEKYGHTKETAEEIIRSVEMPVQHRHYKNHEDALLDFQRLNFGTMLTPYEYFAGLLRYMDCYESHWKPLLDDLHDAVAKNAARVIAKSRRTTRKKYRHNNLRSDYGLLFRFVTKDVSVSPYKTASPKVSLNDIHKGTSIEARLKVVLLDIGHDEAVRQLKLLKGLIERETALIEAIWVKTARGKSIGAGIVMNLYRHIIDAAIWRKNLSVPTDLWKDYVTKLLSNTQGTAQVVNPDDNRDRVPISFNDIQKVRRSCKILDCEFYSHGVSKKEQNSRTSQAKPGFDDSHLVSKNKIKGGATVLEPASLNRARGAKSMTQDEIDFVMR